MHKIIHIDMDVFFASIEQRDNPTLRNKPIVVGGDLDGRGVASTASYEVRSFDIHSAMSCHKAHTLCPSLIFVRPRFEVYQQVSHEILSIMQRFSDKIEPLSLDEAFLDVTDNPNFGGSATWAAQHLRYEVYATTGLTASAGVSFNKMLAKIASDLNKPNGITTITPQEAPIFIDSLPIEKFFGIGKASASKLHAIGRELKALSVRQLCQLFGNKRGQFYYDIVHLQDNRKTKPRQRKSFGSEITLLSDLSDSRELMPIIIEQATKAYALLSKHLDKGLPTTVTLKIKYSILPKSPDPKAMHWVLAISIKA